MSSEGEREKEIKKGRRYEALEGINNRRGVFKGKKKKRREKRCQRHQKLKYKSILFSYLSLTCSLTYTHTRIVSKKGSGYETNKPRHPLQFTHTIPPINIPPPINSTLLLISVNNEMLYFHPPAIVIKRLKKHTIFFYWKRM